MKPAFDFEDELDTIRLALYEKTKNMTPEEEAAFIIADTEPVIKEFNIKMSPLRPLKPMRRERIAE